MDVIQSIIRERRKVYIHVGGQRIIITQSQLEERPLKEGDELDLEEYDDWLLLRQYRPALNYAVSLLAQRAYATGEMEQKLRRIGFRPCTIEMVLFKLTSNDLMDDAEFAKQWAASRSRVLGPTRIAQELRRKGVTREDADAALSAIDSDTHVQAAASYARKALARAKAGEDPRKTVQRAMALLARRGYNYDVSKQAIELAKQTDDEHE